MIVQTSVKSTSAELSILTQAMGESPNLLRWLTKLEKQSQVERRNEIFWILARMKEQREDERIISSLALLTDADIFAATLQALHEAGKI